MKRIRDQVKDEVYRIQEEYFFESPEQILEGYPGGGASGGGAGQARRTLPADVSGQKGRKNLVDFADLEHYALEILVRKEGEETVPPLRPGSTPWNLKRS